RNFSCDACPKFLEIQIAQGREAERQCEFGPPIRSRIKLVTIHRSAKHRRMAELRDGALELSSGYLGFKNSFSTGYIDHHRNPPSVSVDHDSRGCGIEQFGLAANQRTAREGRIENSKRCMALATAQDGRGCTPDHGLRDH